MAEDKRGQAFRRDRKGEIFQDELGEENLPPPPVRDDAAHELNVDEEVNSQEADDFMRRHYGKPTSENPPEQPPK
ncbi:MAG TPA: hypothetical protein VKB39_08460 [Candidatus Baltobacteraceae bacterium]|nr:hypothetical protein [Candidatus Baltobacteraceae bacterium]